MADIHGFSGKEVIRILAGMGFVIKRTKCSHVVLQRASDVCVIPLHSELAEGTLRSVLRQAGVSAREFLNNA